MPPERLFFLPAWFFFSQFLSMQVFSKTMGPEEKSDAEVDLTRVVSIQAAVGLIPERLAQVKPATLFNQRVVFNPNQEATLSN